MICLNDDLVIFDYKDYKNNFDVVEFDVLIVVDKVRNSWRYEDYEISIDTVKNFGDYIEIEYKGTENTNISDIIKNLNTILEKINANIGEEDHGGYGFKLIKQKFNG